MPVLRSASESAPKIINWQPNKHNARAAAGDCEAKFSIVWV
jgi:hypothetical protein